MNLYSGFDVLINFHNKQSIPAPLFNRFRVLFCVWIGKRIGRYALDHVIPFSIWKNNDLWNLLPAASNVNAAKSDKIPSPELIERQRDRILEYWEILHKHQQQRFQKEIQVALLGNHAFDTWKQEGISQLQNSCNYLIETRGFEAWEVRVG